MNTLLIVEDEKMIRQGIKTIAQRSSVVIHNIIECKNGQEALEIIKTQVVDVMITDIRMPKMDGITLVHEMQKCSNIPLTVVVSGYDDFSYAVELLRYGVKEYILKPLERTQINHVLVRLDKEIQDKNEQQNKILKMKYQLIKYLVLSKDISKYEAEVIINQFNHLFVENNYVVCCTNYDKDIFPEKDGIIYLQNVEKQGLFIVDECKLEKLLSMELRDLHVGCSIPHKGLQELKEAYSQALEARKRAFISGEHVVQYKEENKKFEVIEEQRINQIVQILGTAKIAEAIRDLDHIYYKCKIQKISPDEFCEGMNILLNKVVSLYKNVINMNQKENILEQEIYTYHTALDFYNALKDWLVKLNGKLMSEFNDYRNKQKIQEAILYLNENYYKNLNMAVVSNSISMNYSLFSYAFKQYTGHNFVNYLKNIRITEAKRLLEATDMHVIEIGKAVGYENEKNFMKIFKCICGVSPTEYRKNALLGRK